MKKDNKKIKKTLLLPAYATEEEMETRLKAVIENKAPGFDEAAVAT